MSDPNEMLDKAIDAFEESTGEAPNDYELAELKALIHLDEENGLYG